METQVRTPQLVFMMPQRLEVPLFQRPYVWNRENQWEPLWEDVVRLAERVLRNPAGKNQPHFLGAVVLQQIPNPIGLMQTRTIIDGQQRLTTLQLLLDALHAALVCATETTCATRIEGLITNPAAFCTTQADRFKVWPTNRDRPAFNAVMGMTPPVSYDSIPGQERMVEAHRYFFEEASSWLSRSGPGDLPIRAAAIDKAVRDLLQIVVIDLTPDENAQEIFETLNARGAQLTAADLIKNFVFQQLVESGAEVEAAYANHWKEFESGFWETEVSFGRVRYPRSSIFLNHWLIARTGEEVVAREVFDRFKRYASFESHLRIEDLLAQLHRASSTYEAFVRSATKSSGPLDRLGLFAYRTSVMESEVVKPLVLLLIDPNEPAIAPEQLNKALSVLESWMVRRMLVRATTKSYGKIVTELVAALRAGKREHAGDEIERFFACQTSSINYWPDDDELRDELETLPLYRRLSRGRLRMVLEAIEDRMRGWSEAGAGLGGERVTRSVYAIEHVMPRKWQRHWPLFENSGEADRERRLHTLGNLTLLTGKLNSKVSNGPWIGQDSKKAGLESHDVLFLNRDLLKNAGEQWSEGEISKRTRRLADMLISIWPVPPGHKANFSHQKPRLIHTVQLIDLVNNGYLSPRIPLYPRMQKYRHRVATLLPDGQIEVDGFVYESPTPAASAIAGKRRGGWSFFVTDLESGRTLKRIRQDYISTLAMDGDDEDEDGADDDDDDER
jgi:hypothetical protein